ncbi:uncharacterized protein LOC141668145 [Apium graveolens]|uniref:uncharacterized protein LOC141668145 n=1 Tax=Apium graveolens TaxID=4045 RepID=UPI003D78DF8C
MITTKLKPLNPRHLTTIVIQNVFIHINTTTPHSQSYHTHKPSPKNSQPHRPTRKPISFLTNIKQINDPDEALSLFHHYHQLGFKHDYPSYSSLIYKLSKARSFDAVEMLLGYLKSRDVRCGEALFIGIIKHLGKAGLIDKAIEVFMGIKGFNCGRTVQSFNTILNVLVDNERIDDANMMFGNARMMGFRLNSVSFNVMIKGWLVKGEWEVARKVFDEMLVREVEPSVVTYNCQIGFLCKRGEFDKAKELFDEMIKRGKHANAVTYGLLMEGLCCLGKFKEAKNLMFDMEYQGCKPRLVNYGVLMSDIVKNGKWDEAKELLGEMKKRRVEPDVVIYNILINYLCKDGRTADAYKLLVEMQVEGCEPNAATYRIMVDGFCSVEDFEGGLKVLNAMLMSNHCPRLETFCCLIVGLTRSGKIDDACYILEEINKKKLRFNSKLWDSLVQLVSEKGEAAVELVNELICAG